MKQKGFHKLFTLVSLLVLASMLLGACGGAQQTTAPTAPPVATTAPPVATTAPPVATTAPAVEATKAPEATTAPTLAATQPPAAGGVEITEPVTLRLVGFEVAPEERDTPLYKAYQEFLKNFQAENPNVKIDSLETPPEFDTQLLVDLAAGTAPDIWSQDASTLARLVDGGYAQDMRACLDLIPQLTLDRFYKSVLTIHQRSDGSIFGLPNDFTPMVIYYNPKVFKDLGVDVPKEGWTWDDLVKTATALTVDANGKHPGEDGFDEKNVVHYGYRVRQYSFEWIYRVWENGSDVISPDGKTASGYLDSEKTIEAITFHSDLLLKHKVSPPLDTLDQLTQQLGFLDRFLKGDFAMFDRGHWELVGLRNSKEYTKDNLFVVPQPVKENGDTVIYESSFVIKNGLKGEQLKAACKLVEQLTSRKYQDTKVLTGIAISANREAAEAAASKAENPDLEKAFLSQVEKAHLPYGALYAKWPTVEQILDGMMEKILKGTAVNQAVKDAVTEINRELGQ